MSSDHQPDKTPQQQQPSEEDSAFPLTFYTFSWISPLFARGWQMHKAGAPLQIDDILKLPEAENIHTTYDGFRSEWTARVDAWRAQCVLNPALVAKPPSLFAALARPNTKHLVIAGVMRVVADGLFIAMPFILREFIAWLVRYVRRKSTAQDGWIWAVALAVAQLLASIASNISYYHSIRAHAKMRVACLLALFDKSMHLESDHEMAGLITQMHTTDTFKFLELGVFFFQIFTGPLSIIAALIGLYYFIGWAGVLSIVIIIIVMPFQTIVVSKLFAHRSAGAQLKDSRLQAVSEALSGIRIVKFMNWEKQFANRIAAVRGDELLNLRWLYFFRSWMIIISNAQPFLVSFAVYVIAYGFGAEISAETVFPTTAMLVNLRMPLIFLPLGIGKAVDVNVSLERIRAFLLRTDRRQYLTVDPDTSGDAAIEMTNVSVLARAVSSPTAHHGDPSPTASSPTAASPSAAPEGATSSEQGPSEPLAEVLLADISLAIPKGKLVAIVGPTGCGKSTLLAAMIGESIVTDASAVRVFGSRAYMAQQAWITNATLRDNILMGQPYDAERYLRAVNCCQLIPDLEELTGSDQTEIGEKGINLSGGQKQRVAFARAVYSNRDTILMDDPLSAVDSHVCLGLFEECILGALDGRTRILVTHQVQFLPRCDVIIVMDKCKIIFQGTYEAMTRTDLDIAAMVAKASPQSTSHKDPVVYDDGVPSPASPVAARPAAGALRSHSTEIPAPKHAQQQQLMVAEHLEQGYFSLSTVAWYFARQGWPLVAFYLFFFCVWRAASAVADLIVSWWSSRTPVLGYELTSAQYIQWYGIFIGITIVTLLFRQFALARAFLLAATASHDGMVSRILHAPTSFFDTTPMGRIVSRFSKDVEELDNQMPEKMNFFLGLVYTLLGVFVIMCYGAPYLSIMIVFFIAFVAAIFRYHSATNRAQKRLEALYVSPVVSTMCESVNGLATIRAYDSTHIFLAKHNSAVHNMARTEYSWRVSLRWLGLRTDAMSSVIIAATTLLTVGLMTSYSRATQLELLPIMSLGVTYSLNIGLSVGFLTAMTADVEASFSSIERVKEFSETVPQERDVVYSTEDSSSRIDPPSASWPLHGELRFANASLRYRDNLPLVLDDVTLAIPAGSKVGIVGRTGSGKSTMMLALFRMVELASGSITLDGRDIADLKLDDLRSKITIIPQDPLLFHGTVRSNLDPFQTSTTEEVMAVVERVGLRERIERDALGIDGPVATNGSNFSVGQRQLLCLARALLKRCKLLLLDEATASVDFECDLMIQQTIRREFSACTVLTIAHRLATVVDSDRVCVLDHGKVAEYDQPAVLLRRSDSAFSQMVQKLGPEQFLQLKAVAEEKEASRSA